MPLQPGDKFGPYELIAPIGKGGMGEVWKARDTRLDRIVAMKFSQEKFSERFEREAKAISSLNHPNICTLYDVGPNYLVMEYIEGTPLKGPLPLDQALKYAAQICDALDAAHKKGITHRDLKPANILVTKAGIKLLDFGLAKLGTSGIGQAPKPDDATLTMALTGKNEIVGTLYYMSPEQLQSQATGKEIDGRSDIFSFGLVLFEMLTGKRAFEGASPASVIAAIMERPAPSVADIAPPALDRVMRKCLAKDPDDRWQTARDLKGELEWIASSSGEGTTIRPAVARHRLLPWILVAFATIVAVAFGFEYFREPRQEPQVTKLSVLPPENTKLKTTSLIAMSPDGRHLAFVATRDRKDEIWVRDMDSLAARPLLGTDGANDPFWSPDSQSIAFFADGKLKKIQTAGGSPLTLCDAGADDRGGTWSKNGTIVFAPTSTGGLFQVSAEGGNAMPVATPDVKQDDITDRFPSFLPDGRHFLYTALGKHSVYVGELDSPSRREVIAADSNVKYVPPGYLLFLRAGTLMAQPFDSGGFKVQGGPVPVAEKVVYGVTNGRGEFSVSEGGAIAYILGGEVQGSQLTWFDRTGKSLGIVGPPSQVSQPRISPDGKLVAVDRGDPQMESEDIWLYDISRSNATRFTFNSKQNRSRFPVWAPDGNRIAFVSNRGGRTQLYQRALSGDAHDEGLDQSGGNRPVDWSHDGRFILEEIKDQATNSYNINVLPLFGDRKSYPYLQTASNERHASLSPNGLWLVYESDETKRNEVYVQTFPKPGGKWQVSTGGGHAPIWSKDGKELFFVSADGKMMAVEVKPGAQFEAGLPKPLFDVRLGGEWFDVSSDGRFLIPTPLESSNPSITVVLNWQAGLKK